MIIIFQACKNILHIICCRRIGMPVNSYDHVRRSSASAYIFTYSFMPEDHHLHNDMIIMQ